MDKDAEIITWQLMHKNAEERANLWETLANCEKGYHNGTKAEIWEVMGRGVHCQNEYGDVTEVILGINDWRALCRLVNFGGKDVHDF